MTDLDDLAALKELDSDDFLSHLEGFPDQLALGLKLGREASGIPLGLDVRAIAVLGMGGSGVSGDILQAVLEQQSPAFVAPVKNYELPRWVGRDTLVFAVSYSGTTEETLHALAEAGERGAPIVVISSGDSIAEAAPPGSAVIKVPPGLPPRAALGYLVMPMLVICHRLGLCDLEEAISETLELVEARREEYKRQTPASSNPAKRLAQELVGTFPIVYGSEGIGKVAAYRWKCQFNECSKLLSYSSAFPELDHNELEGWDDSVSVPGPPLTVIALRHGGDINRIGARIDFTLSMIERRAAGIEQVSAMGASALARLMDLIYLGDFTAAYLGLAQGADPGRLQAIPALKAQMDRTSEQGPV